MKIYEMAPGPECAPGITDYWAAVTDVPCPACQKGTIRWDEADHVPGYRTCDECNRHFISGGNNISPTLIEQEN